MCQDIEDRQKPSSTHRLVVLGGIEDQAPERRPVEPDHLIGATVDQHCNAPTLVGGANAYVVQPPAVGNITLHYKSRLYHAAIGRKHSGTGVLVLVADLDVRVLKMNGELIRNLTLDPDRAYQGLGT